MVNNDSHRSIHANKSNLSIRNSGDVLVFAGRKMDADTLCAILVRAGYEPHWYSELAEYSDLSSGNIVATVLCHIACSPDPAVESRAINLPCQLPGHLRSKRLIVVSDCLTEQTIISLLDSGAHHCFSLNESPRLLQVRLEAALRWHVRSAGSLQTHGDIAFDVQKRRVTRAGCIVELSPKEYELAYYLFSNRDRVVENGELLTTIWSLPADMDTRRIDTAACRVRKKLRLTAAYGWELRRLRRIGYRLVRTQG